MKCPGCMSHEVWKDGVRQTHYGDVQRYLCRGCGHRFSDSKVQVGVVEQRLVLPDSVHDLRQLDAVNMFPGEKRFKNPPLSGSEDVSTHSVSVVGKPINSFPQANRECRVGARKGKAKNLATVEPLRNGLAGATRAIRKEIKGKIVEFAWYLKKEGYSDSTIIVWTRTLRQLVRLGANLLDQNSIKDAIAKRDNWSETSKLNAASCYSTFAKANGILFTMPKYSMTQKLPFIPTEKELDQLIAGCGKRTATFLQLLKETGMRSGEAWQIRWADLDDVQKTLRLNNPEKRGNSRMFRISAKLTAMLSELPKKSDRIFPTSLAAKRAGFTTQRKKVAEKLKNQRINRITFHTFRHWKATIEYHKTKDILHVKQLLGHKRIEATMIYTQLISFQSDNYHVKVAKSLKEACELVKAGFEFVTDMEGKKIFRKRK